MKRSVPVILVALLAFLLLGSVSASRNPVLWKGTLCENVKYQKSIEAVAMTNDSVYAACSYRQVVSSKSMVEIYYLGTLGAFSLDGRPLWNASAGYAVKIVPLKGRILVGSFGGITTFLANGTAVNSSVTRDKLYDFVVSDGRVYAVDGDFYVRNTSVSYVGHLYSGELVDGKAVLNGWVLNFSEVMSRVRVGNGIVYASSGFPSGYVGRGQFGSLYGVSQAGRLLWKVHFGHWVRDLEVWKGNAVLGTGWDDSKGRLYVVSPSGRVLLNESLFYTEDVLVLHDTAYIGGYDGKNGTLVAVELPSGRILWERKLPYRVKVLAYTEGVLLAGTGRFVSKTENGTAYVYSVGNLYAVSPKDGKILGELPNTGYVRSIAVEGGRAVIGTASSTFYVIDVGALKGSQKSSICGPGFVVLLAVLILLLRRIT